MQNADHSGHYSSLEHGLCDGGSTGTLTRCTHTHRSGIQSGPPIGKVGELHLKGVL